MLITKIEMKICSNKDDSHFPSTDVLVLTRERNLLASDSARRVQCLYEDNALLVVLCEIGPEYLSV